MTDRNAVGKVALSRSSSERLRRLLIVLLLVLLTVFLGIVFQGSQNTHRGSLILRKSQATGPRSAETPATAFGGYFTADLESNSELFRGSDLFRVSEVMVGPDVSIDVDTLCLDPACNEGVLSFASTAKIDQGQPIPATFRLQVYERKVYPAVAILIALLSLLLAVPWYQRLPSTHLLKSNKAPSGIAVGCMLAMLFVLVISSVANPGWTYGDSHQFLSTTVQGKVMWASVYPELGRFFPLGLMDNNLLIPFGNSPLAYQSERAILLCVAVAAMFVLAWRISDVKYASLATLVFLTTPDLFRVYSESIFPEAQLVMWLVLFFLFYHRAYDSSGNIKFRIFDAVIACVCAAAATYCKEPAFGLLIIFSVVQVAFGYRKQNPRTLAIHGFIAVNAVVFLTLYWVWCSGGQNYAAIRSEGSGATILSTALLSFSSPMAVLAILVAVYRVYRIALARDRAFLYSDGILLAGMGYGFAYCLLKLGMDYYMVPAHVCWALAIAGYMKGIDVSALDLQHRISPRPMSIYPIKLIAYAALGAVLLQASGTRKCVQNSVADREDCQRLSQIFSQLDREGYRMLVYAPDSLQGHPRSVQHWRMHVLNVFAATDEVESQKNHAPPFTFANLDEVNHEVGKKIVICPPELEADFCGHNTQGQNWRKVTESPRVMGARIFSIDQRVTELIAMADEETNVY